MVNGTDAGTGHSLGEARWDNVDATDHLIRGGATRPLRSTVSAIVLAGSYRQALDPVSQLIRDPLLPIAQLPVISYPLAWLRSHPVVRDIVICANDATAAVRNYFGESGGVERACLQYYAEDHPRGPAGCVRDAAQLAPSGTIVVVEGSLLPSLDLDALLAAHVESGAAATTVVESERRTNGSARPRLPGGVYVFEREALDLVAPRGFQDIKQGLLERLYDSGARVHVREIAGVSPRIRDFASYSAASRWLVWTASRRSASYQGYVPVGEGMHHVSASVSPRATFVGPVLVGPDAIICDDAVVVGPTCVGPGAQIRERATVARSVLLEDSVVEARAYLDDSLLAPGTRIEAHAHVSRHVRLARETGTRVFTPTLRAAGGRGFGSVSQDPILARVASRGQ